MKSRNPFSDTSFSGSRLPVVALLLVQLVIAYEWLNSAVTKIVRGGFATGLGAQLAKNSDGSPDWYKTVLSTVVIPHSATFGYLIVAGEMLVGVGLIAATVVLFVRGHRLNITVLRGVLAVVAVTTVSGAFMNLNFSLFSGDPTPWSLGGDAFSEGVNIDKLLLLMQLAIAGASASMIYTTRPPAAAQLASADHRQRTARRAA